MSKICGANESKWPRRGGNLKREGKREMERESETVELGQVVSRATDERTQKTLIEFQLYVCVFVCV